MNTVVVTDKTCQHCGARMVRAGFRRINISGDRKQQWQCTKCYRRTMK